MGCVILFDQKWRVDCLVFDFALFLSDGSPVNERCHEVFLLKKLISSRHKTYRAALDFQKQD